MKQYYIGIDLGGTNTKIALLGKRFTVLKKTSLPTPLYKRPLDLIFAIKNSINNILRAYKVPLREVYGIGIGVAGLVDAENGVIRNLVNIPGWKGVNIKRLFNKAMKVPTYVDNDANVMTLAELHKGAGRGKKNLVCVTLGTGVGGGIIIDGKLYRGSMSTAGEIGHIPINEKGPRCNCGGTACVEAYVGNRYMIRELIRIIKSGKKTVLRRMTSKGLSHLTPEVLYKAARYGDRFAIDFWKTVGTRIGIALTGVINLLNPDRIIIGGGVAGAGRFLFMPIRDTVKNRAMEAQRKHIKVVKAKLGLDAGLIGAAILVHTEKNK
ncbi:ROK family protein [Omnitrophica bacterium]|nr:ROK family protein [Candidatus Omnitrophota bacterium]